MTGSPTVSSHTFSGTYRRSHAFISMTFAGLVLLLIPFKSALSAEESSEPKSIRMTCGTCPSAYGLTGVTTDATLCKEGEPTVVQCVPLGVNMLSVCGSCPEGYIQVGGSMVPVRSGAQEGGRMSQCRLQKMESTLPDPTQRGVICPPNCGSTAAPGQGAIPPPPKFRPAPEKKSGQSEK